MKSGFLRILLIMFLVSAFAAGGVTTLNFLGRFGEHPQLKHPLVQDLSAGPWAKPGQSYKFRFLNPDISNKTQLASLFQESRQSFSQAQNVNKTLLIINVYADEKGQWWAFDGKDKHTPTAVNLVKFLDEYQVKHLALQIHSSREGDLKRLAAMFTDRGLNENVVVFAEEYKVIKKLRNMVPRWLYSATESMKLKASFMSSLMLETIASLDFDVWVLSTTRKDNHRLLAELKRRHKILLYKENVEERQVDPKLNELLMGVIVERHNAPKHL